jgi:hypothetical protein
MGMSPRPRPGSPGPAGSRREGQSHLFTAYAYEWIILSLAVRNYPQRKKMAQQASRQPGLRPRRLGRCSPAVAPIYRGTASRCGGVVCWGDEGGSVTPPLSTSPSLEDPDLGGLHSLPFCCPSNGAQISLSLSLCTHVSSPGACFTSCFAASSGKVASRASPRPPPRPCAKSRVP